MAAWRRRRFCPLPNPPPGRGRGFLALTPPFPGGGMTDRNVHRTAGGVKILPFCPFSTIFDHLSVDWGVGCVQEVSIFGDIWAVLAILDTLGAGFGQVFFGCFGVSFWLVLGFRRWDFRVARPGVPALPRPFKGDVAPAGGYGRLPPLPPRRGAATRQLRARPTLPKPPLGGGGCMAPVGGGSCRSGVVRPRIG